MSSPLLSVGRSSGDYPPKRARELYELEALVLGITLTEEPKEHSCFFEDDRQRLQTSLIYKASSQSGSTCPSFSFLWRNFAPPRVKMFGWLLTKQRIQCKVALVRKLILQDAKCDICGQEEETADHIISCCIFAQEFWARMGWNADNIAPVQRLWETTSPHEAPANSISSIILLYCWELWKHRHDVVFRGMNPNHERLIAACRQNTKLWQCRLPRNNTPVHLFWCNLTSNM